MKKSLFLLTLFLPVMMAAQDVFPDFFNWRESFRYVADDGSAVVVRTEPGNETYLVTAEMLSNGDVSVRLESDITVVSGNGASTVMPDSFLQAYFASAGGEGPLRYSYVWENPRMAVERSYAGDPPDDLDTHPYRRAGNGKGVYDVLSVMARLRQGGGFSDMVGATVVHAGRQYFVSGVRRVLSYSGDGTVAHYTVGLYQKNFISLSVESDGYHRPVGFEIRMDKHRIKGRLAE